MADATYQHRLDALEQAWLAWGRTGGELTEEQWATSTRCRGWDVAAVYAHHSLFPLALSTGPSGGQAGAGEPRRAVEVLSAVEVLRRFNAPGGVATTLAGAVAGRAVTEARQHSRAELVQRFTALAPGTLYRLRGADGGLVVPWPAAGSITLAEALRIVLMEATVHLLDIQRALGQDPAVPDAALHSTVRLLAEVAPAVGLVEAATGRATESPLPVVR
jgi:uncharacterized protein (TIGR03083 family)